MQVLVSKIGLTAKSEVVQKSGPFIKEIQGNPTKTLVPRSWSIEGRGQPNFGGPYWCYEADIRAQDSPRVCLKLQRLKFKNFAEKIFFDLFFEKSAPKFSIFSTFQAF